MTPVSFFARKMHGRDKSHPYITRPQGLLFMLPNQTDVFTEPLLPDEKIMWTGRPQLSLWEYSRDMVKPYSGIIIVFAFITLAVIGFKWFIVLAGAAVCIGVPTITLAARIELKQLRSGEVVNYTVTNKRVLVQSKDGLQTLFIHQIPGFILQKQSKNIGTIVFHIAYYPNLYRIEQPETVYNLLNKLLDKED